MNKLMLMGGAAMLALSGAAFAQTTEAVPAPDAATAPSPADASNSPEAAPAAPDAEAPVPPVAQSTEPAADAPDVPAAASVPAPAEAPAPGASAPTTAEPMPPSAPAQQTATADAAAKVNAEWAKYDEGKKGKLTPLEFGTWIMAAKGQDTAQVEKTKTSKKAGLSAVKVLNETASDFTKADTDKDRMISPDEMAVFLSA